MSEGHGAGAPRRWEGRRPLVALVGNPNTGKTTLFNRLTGQNARVGNYPGITVERRVGEARLPDGLEIDVLDVPGAYSLSARSPEEAIALQATLGLGDNPRPDLVVVVLDATALVRNLYLALQLVELGEPLLLAVNMIDEVGERAPDLDAINALLNAPAVGLSARTGHGLDALRSAIGTALRLPATGRVSVDYPAPVREALSQVEPALPAAWRGRATGLGLWALLSLDEDDELADVDPGLRAAALDAQRRAREAGVDLDDLIIGARYALLDAAAPRLVPAPPPARRATDRIDRVVLHPVWGFALFIGVMVVMFQSLFSWADPAIGLIEDAFGWLAGVAGAVLPAGVLADLVVNGLIGGVGNVLVFLPQILLLFLFIGFLEDSGYMARVAYLMDRIMRSLGLHGRAFVPMMSGYACAVPAIMATRTMERQRDRLLTMMVVPLMSCSARLPVYTLMIGALFPPSPSWGGVPVQGLLMAAMYLFSTVTALVAAGVLGRTVLKGRHVPLILELPPYRLPSPGSVLRLMWERSRLFLSEAGTVILACTVALWALLSYPEPPGQPGPDAPEAEVAAWEAERLEHSVAGRLGHTIEPVLAPLGFDWKIGVGLIGAFAAREVFVSTMGLVYGVGGDVDEESDSLRDRMRAETRPDGTPVYTPLVGLSLMVFFALAAQCMSTLAVLKRETGSWRWPTFVFAYMSALAWITSFLVYQGGRLLGY